MTKRAIQALCVVALVAAAFVLRGRTKPLPETPEAAVKALFDAAARGDDEAYLRLVAGGLAESLRDARSQAGAEAFRGNLRRAAADIKGLAVTRAGDEQPPSVALDVELVFVDRVERQRIVASPADGGWVVTAIGSAAATKPAIPYGTPVFEQ